MNPPACHDEATPAFGGRYRLQGLIARGGMGEVWRATDEVLGRAVALKVLRPEYADEEVFLRRFAAEARNTAALVHTGIAQVYDFGRAQLQGAEVPFIVMELVPGEPLSRILARDGALGPDRALDLVAQAARALQAAHEAGVVHRDVKPANLLVTPTWSVKVTDFGIARAVDALPLTRSGTVMGTAHYLAPEMVRSRGTATPSADVYALGVVLYECLAGRRPFIGDDPLAVAMAHINDAPPPLPHLPEVLGGLLEDLLSKNPADRPGTAGELARRLVALRVELAVRDADPDATLALGERGAPATAARLPAGALPATEPHGMAIPGADPGRARRAGAARLAHTAADPGAADPDAADPDAADPGAADPGAADRQPHRHRARPPKWRSRPMLIGAAAVSAFGLFGAVWLGEDGSPRVAPVPSVTGGSESLAQQTLSALGFDIEVTREVNGSVPAGVVMVQSPTAGTRTPTGTDVSILVSSGPAKVRVDPADWIGRPAAEVRDALTARGLRVIEEYTDAEGVAGTVVDVAPVGLLSVGDAVVIMVAVSGPNAGVQDQQRLQTQPRSATVADARSKASSASAPQASDDTTGTGEERDQQ